LSKFVGGYIFLTNIYIGLKITTKAIFEIGMSSRARQLLILRKTLRQTRRLSSRLILFIHKDASQ